MKNAYRLVDAFRVRNLFAEMAEQQDFIVLVYGGEPRPDRLMVRYALWIHTFGDALYHGRHFKFLLFHDLEITDNVYCRFWSDQGKLVQLFVLKELVGDFYDALSSVQFAGEVYPYCNLVLCAVFYIQYVKCLVHTVRRDVVYYCPVFKRTYFQFFMIVFHDIFLFICIRADRRLLPYGHKDRSQPV